MTIDAQLRTKKEKAVSLQFTLIVTGCFVVNVSVLLNLIISVSLLDFISYIFIYQ